MKELREAGALVELGNPDGSPRTLVRSHPEALGFEAFLQVQRASIYAAAYGARVERLERRGQPIITPEQMHREASAVASRALALWEANQ